MSLLLSSLAGCDSGAATQNERLGRTVSGLSLALEDLACSRGSFVLTYNYRNTDEWADIAALPALPAFVVVDDLQIDSDGPVDPSDRSRAPGWFHLHTDPEVRKIRVIKYVPTNYSTSSIGPCVVDSQPRDTCDNAPMNAPQDNVCQPPIPIETRIFNAMQSGFDGIFFDETNPPASVAYVQDCAAKVKNTWGDTALVIINPGSSGSHIYAYYDRNVDIISVERNVDTAVRDSGIPAIHFLAVEDFVDTSTATTHLATFRGNGGFWYFGKPVGYSDRPDYASVQTVTSAADPGRPDCGCVAPDSRNLLSNPGFNGTLEPWIRDPGPGASFSYAAGSSSDIYGNSGDAKGCTSSGSVLVSAALDGSGDGQRIWQCVSVAAQAKYNFGVHVLGQGAYAYCDLDLYESPDCSGDGTNAAEVLWLNVTWSPDLRSQITTPPGTASARVSCRVEGGGPAYFDLPYLTPAPGEF